jgi:hypothetical protein
MSAFIIFDVSEISLSYECLKCRSMKFIAKGDVWTQQTAPNVKLTHPMSCPLCQQPLEQFVKLLIAFRTAKQETKDRGVRLTVRTPILLDDEGENAKKPAENTLLDIGTLAMIYSCECGTELAFKVGAEIIEDDYCPTCRRTLVQLLWALREYGKFWKEFSEATESDPKLSLLRTAPVADH